MFGCWCPFAVVCSPLQREILRRADYCARERFRAQLAGFLVCCLRLSGLGSFGISAKHPPKSLFRWSVWSRPLCDSCFLGLLVAMYSTGFVLFGMPWDGRRFVSTMYEGEHTSVTAALAPVAEACFGAALRGYDSRGDMSERFVSRLVSNFLRTFRACFVLRRRFVL